MAGGFDSGFDSGFDIDAESVTITVPSDNARLLVGETIAIDAASTAGVSGQWDIDLSLDNGSTFSETIGSAVAIPYDWVPLISQLTAQGVIRISDAVTPTTTHQHSIVIATTSLAGGGMRLVGAGGLVG